MKAKSLGQREEWGEKGIEKVVEVVEIVEVGAQFWLAVLACPRPSQKLQTTAMPAIPSPVCYCVPESMVRRSQVTRSQYPLMSTKPAAAAASFGRDYDCMSLTFINGI